MIGGYRWVEVPSSLGKVYRFQVPRLPAIHRQILESVVFLYPSEDAARESRPVGGTGFLMSTPVGEAWDPHKHGMRPEDFAESDERHLYAVTAAHVVRHGGTVVRLNNHADVEILPVPPGAWKCHPDGADIATARLGMADQRWLERSVSSKMCITTYEALHASFRGPTAWGGPGPGDDCFFIGRFSTHEGRDQNRPSVRFGALAMSHGETIRDAGGFEQESFLVEARSLSGYSGSPVFVYKSSLMDDDGTVKPLVSSAVRLLGVDWCHLSQFEEVLAADKKTPVDPPQFVRSNTGMAGVIPAWKLVELLNDPEVLKMRDAVAQDQAIKEERERQESPGGAVLDSAGEAERSDFERFEDLTRKLVNTPKAPKE